MLKTFWTLVWLLVALTGPAQTVAEDAAEAPAAAESAPPPTEQAEPEAAPADTAAPAESAATDSQKYDLIYKFSPGEQVRTEIVHKAAVQTTIDGSTQKAETQSKSVKVWRVDEVQADGTVKFLHTVESIDMWQRTQGRKEVRYNSQTDTEVPPGYEDVAAAVGKPLTIVTMNSRGKILKREEKRAQPIGASTQMTIPLPEGPIAIGETWNYPVDIDVTLSEGGTKKIHTRQKFTLEKVVDGLATIAVDSQVLTPIHDPSIEAQLIQRMSAGTVKFDLKAGRVVSQQLDLDRHVIGFSGAASSMHYVTRFTEELLPAAQQTVKRSPPAKAAAAKSAAPATGTAAPKTASPAKVATQQSASASSPVVKKLARQAAAPKKAAPGR